MGHIEKLTTPQRTRLTGILSRLASPFDGERAAAALLASAFIARHQLEWADIADFVEPAAEGTPGDASALLVTKIADDATPRQDRRNNSNHGWHGYCRRRRVMTAEVLNTVA